MESEQTEKGENKYKLLQYRELSITGKYQLSESMKRTNKDKKADEGGRKKI